MFQRLTSVFYKQQRIDVPTTESAMAGGVSLVDAIMKVWECEWELKEAGKDAKWFNSNSRNDAICDGECLTFFATKNCFKKERV